jgi:hypothetical protein
MRDIERQIMKKKCFIVFLTLLGLLTVGILTVGIIVVMRNHSNYTSEQERMRTQALHLAQTYLDDKYEQDMEYVKYDYNFFEMYYLIYFHPIDNPDILFNITVIEREDDSLEPEERVRLSGDDNYFERYIEYELSKIYISDIEAIWGAGTVCNISLINHRIPEDQRAELVSSTAEIVYELLDNSYNLFIKPTYSFEEKSISELAKMVLDTLNIINQHTHQPHSIFIDKFNVNDRVNRKQFTFISNS